MKEIKTLDFFQKIVTVQQKRSSIRNLTDANGVKLTTFAQISNEAVAYFKKLIGTRDEAVSGCPMNIFKKLLHYSVAEVVALALFKLVSAEEIRQIVFSIGNDKALGPYGYSVHFSKSAWSIIEHDVIAAVSQYFQTKLMLPAFMLQISLWFQKFRILVLSRIFAPFLVVLLCTSVLLNSFLIGLSLICQPLSVAIKVLLSMAEALQIIC